MIAFLDADDVWMPDFLASQIVFLDRHGFDMAYCDACLFGMNSAYRRTFMETAPSTGECDFNAILDLRCNVITSGTMVKDKRSSTPDVRNRTRAGSRFPPLAAESQNWSKDRLPKKQLLKYRVGQPFRGLDHKSRT